METCRGERENRQTCRWILDVLAYVRQTWFRCACLVWDSLLPCWFPRARFVRMMSPCCFLSLSPSYLYAFSRPTGWYKCFRTSSLLVIFLCLPSSCLFRRYVEQDLIKTNAIIVRTYLLPLFSLCATAASLLSFLLTIVSRWLPYLEPNRH